MKSTLTVKCLIFHLIEHDFLAIEIVESGITVLLVVTSRCILIKYIAGITIHDDVQHGEIKNFENIAFNFED